MAIGTKGLFADGVGITGAALLGFFTGGIGIGGGGGPTLDIVFSVQPSAVASGAVISPAVQASVRSNGVVDPTFTGPVTISKAAGTGTLGGTLVINAVSGVATFSTLTIAGAGNHQLHAAASGYTGVDSSTFAVTVPKALAVTTQPSNAVSSVANAGFVLTAYGTDGAVDTAFTGAVSIGKFSGTGALSGNTGNATIQTVNAVAGVATFTLVVTGLGAHVLTGSATGYTSVQSNSFTITAGGGVLVAATMTTTLDSAVQDYLVFYPGNYNDATKQRVVSGYHGSGSRGNNNSSQLNEGLGEYVNNNKATFPSIAILPQEHAGGAAGTDRINVRECVEVALARLITQCNADPSRFYLIGNSMGGDIGYEHVLKGALTGPRLFAAYVSMPGSCVPSVINRDFTPVSPLTTQRAAQIVAAAAVVLRIALWAYVASDDATYYPLTTEMETEFKGVGANFTVTYYGAIGHVATWTTALADPNMWTWLYAQSMATSTRHHRRASAARYALR